MTTSAAGHLQYIMMAAPIDDGALVVSSRLNDSVKASCIVRLKLGKHYLTFASQCLWQLHYLCQM